MVLFERVVYKMKLGSVNIRMDIEHSDENLQGDVKI